MREVLNENRNSGRSSMRNYPRVLGINEVRFEVLIVSQYGTALRFPRRTSEVVF